MGKYKPAENTEEVRQYLEGLTIMLRSGGWKLYEAFLSDQLAGVTEQLPSAKDPHTMAILAGYLKCLKDLSTWPVIQAKALSEDIKRHS